MTTPNLDVATAQDAIAYLTALHFDDRKTARSILADRPDAVNVLMFAAIEAYNRHADAAAAVNLDVEDILQARRELLEEIGELYGTSGLPIWLIDAFNAHEFIAGMATRNVDLCPERLHHIHSMNFERFATAVADEAEVALAALAELTGLSAETLLTQRALATATR